MSALPVDRLIFAYTLDRYGKTAADSDWDLLTRSDERLRIRIEELERVVKLRLEHGHNDTCGSQLGEYPCSCGHEFLAEVLERG